MLRLSPMSRRACPPRPSIKEKRASKPQNAAKDIHNPGAALLPVNSMRVVEIAGVKPPNSAVARQLIVLPSPIAPTHRELIIALAARHRLPAIYPFRYFPEYGGLASYGIDTVDVNRRAATYVDRILKGEKPGDRRCR